VALAAAAVVIVLGSGGPNAWAQGLQPYDGANPFRCELQRVGTGTTFPDPQADPFCVEYDKTNQNVAEFGILDFLAQEPARVAAAAGKCFYYQHDHWTGWVWQNGRPELWHWDGAYWFDLARGSGGAFFGNPRLLGVGGWSKLSPFLPPLLRPYLTTDGYGGQYLSGYPVLTRCAARVDTPAEAAAIYAAP
jgi:hypothetical protein